MILVVDVGNTNIVLGMYQGRELLHHYRISTSRQATADEYGVLIHNLFSMGGVFKDDIEGVIISSVVPPLVHVLEEMCDKYIGRTPLIVGPGIKTGLNLRYENPREVGADRIVNAVAAVERYGGPLVVVDFGTATTFDCIDDKGNYLGGVIVPGIGISTEALYQRASKLPRIELEKPKKVIGTQYGSCYASGDHFWLCRASGRYCGAHQGGNAGRAYGYCYRRSCRVNCLGDTEHSESVADVDAGRLAYHLPT